MSYVHNMFIVFYQNRKLYMNLSNTFFMRIYISIIRYVISLY